MNLYNRFKTVNSWYFASTILVILPLFLCLPSICSQDPGLLALGIYAVLLIGLPGCFFSQRNASGILNEELKQELAKYITFDNCFD
jgi:hypothetical protein